MSQPAWAKWRERESNIIGAIIGYTTIEELIHPSTGYYQITPFVLTECYAALLFLIVLLRESLFFFYFHFLFFSKHEKKMS